MPLGTRFVFKFKRLMRYFGIYKGTIVMPDGVKYRERSGVSLRRALSAGGPGVKEYDVRMPRVDADRRQSMRIRYTKSRVYGDLGHDQRKPLYGQVIDLIRPGMRVLELGCGSGSGTAVLAECVGPSGGVVAVDRDGESIRFARQRHHCGHCAFELGWIESIEGEVNGVFQAVMYTHPVHEPSDSPDTARVLVDLVRVLQGGGLMTVLAVDAKGLDALRQSLLGFDMILDRQLDPCPRTRWCGMMLRKIGEGQQKTDRGYNQPSPFIY